MPALMIYGATGYTGRLVSTRAAELGLDVVLAGRAAAPLERLARELGRPYRVFAAAAAPPEPAASPLRGVAVLLNCAGPFAHTAAPLLARCLAAGVHYLDVAAELAGYRTAAAADAAARRAGVMLLPGCGGSVALLGGLAAVAAPRPGSPPPRRVDAALRVAGPVSRGSAASAREAAVLGGAAPLQCVGGVLVARAADSPATADFDFGDGRGPVPCAPATLPDLVTLPRSTGAPDVAAFVHVAAPAAFGPGDDLDALPPGPTPEERDAHPYHAAVALTTADGTVRRAVLHTMNGYSFTAVASVEAARRVLDGQVKTGFQTPVDVFGLDFLQCCQVTIESLD